MLKVSWVADSLRDFEPIFYGVLHFLDPRIEYPVEAILSQENLCQYPKLFGVIIVHPEFPQLRYLVQRLLLYLQFLHEFVVGEPGLCEFQCALS